MKQGRKASPPKKQHIELLCGPWADVLRDVVADALICDPPYSAATQQGHSAVQATVLNADTQEKYSNQRTFEVMDYVAWGPADVHAFVAAWAPRTRGWMAIMTDDELIPHYREAYRAQGRYSFAPVPIIQHRPRLVGDGPGSCAVYLMVSRPRDTAYSTWGSLSGWYHSETDKTTRIVNGAKPLSLMRKIVLDYSRRGDVIVDPCAGGATTLIAARCEHRSAYGAETDPDVFAQAQARLRGQHRQSARQEILGFGDGA